jgi:glutamate racemase
MNTDKIGFMDSGFGGITVLSEALRQLPRENFIYYADIEHVPYGTKEKEEVKKYVFEAVNFLIGKGIKALVVACNTATSIAVRELRSMYDFPIVGMEPAVKPAVENGNGKRVLVLATALTLREEKFHNLVQRVDQEHVVDYLPFPEMVELAENMVFDIDKDGQCDPSWQQNEPRPPSCYPRGSASQCSCFDGEPRLWFGSAGNCERCAGSHARFC